VSNYQIRVHLPDRPGALGAVASRIGSVGGDVVSIDILEHGGGIVVDELGVVLAGDHLVDLLRAEICEVDGVVIESIRPIDGAPPDRQAEILAVATELIKQTSRSGLLEHLAVRVRRSLSATYSAVFDVADSTVFAGDGELPGHDQLCHLADLALTASTDRDGGDGPAPPSISVVDEDGTAAAALPHAGLVLLVGREGSVLRERERQWVSIMADLADHGWRQLD
jgi:hypothetical protein